MKAMITLIVWSTFLLTAFAQTPKEQTLNSTIANVTVYLKGAFIERSSQAIRVEKGEHTLVFRDLSPYLDPSSVKVKSVGDFTTLSVNHRRDFLKEQEQTEEIETLLIETDGIRDSLEVLAVRQSVLDEEIAFLKNNNHISGKEKAVELEQLKNISTFYERQLTDIRLEKLRNARLIKKLNEGLQQTDLQLRELNLEKQNVSGEVVVKIKAKAATSVQLRLSYLCEHAGWYPTYDLRVERVDQPLRLIQKAHIFQQTGEDWENVRLVFSNDDPEDRGVLPKIKTQFVNFASRYATYRTEEYNELPTISPGTISGIVTDENGEPLIGATILVKGSSIGTVTDFSGRYSLTIPPGSNSILEISYTGFSSQEIEVIGNVANISLDQGASLDEIVVTGSAGRMSGAMIKRKKKQKATIPESTVIENQLNISIALDRPFTVLSNGEVFTVALRELDIPADYEYECIPRLDEHAYLIASITRWEQYQLMAGEMNLYFEDAFVGKSVLDTRYLSDTLRLSIGQDESIIVKRENVADYTSKKFIGSKKTETRTFRIIVRNTKQQPIKLLLKDQIPVSTRKEIEVKSLDRSGGQLDEESGIISWRREILPGDERTFINQYELKYPKSRRLDTR